MKSFPTEALMALQLGLAQIGGAVEILTDDPVRVWSGLSPIELGGNPFLPIGHRELAIARGAALGAPAQNMSLSLSGLEPALIELLDAADLRSAPVVLWIVICDASGRTILHSFVDERGRVDRVPVKETSGGTATITLEVEKAARGLGRKTGRIRSDADQRLIKATDGSFREVAYAAEKVLYWGGERPARAGTALNTIRAIQGAFRP